MIIPIRLAAKGSVMLNKKCLSAVMLAAAAVSSTAMADDRGVNTAFGAVIGAGIGGSTGGRNGAIVGGLLGAAVGSSISTNERSYNNGSYDNYRSSSSYVDTRTTTYYDNRDDRDGSNSRDSYYSEPAPVYVQDSRTVYIEASRPVYYQPRPDYYYSEPYYSRPSAVVHVGIGGSGYRDDYRDDYRGHNSHGHRR